MHGGAGGKGIRARGTGFLLSLLLVMSLIGTALAAVPPKGGSLIIALEGEPASITTHLASDTTALMGAVNVFNSLITMDFNFTPVPDLAEKWTVSQDGLTYTFNLVKNATWHDGKPFTSADVKFTLEQITAQAHPRASTWWPNVAAVDTPDQYTVVMKLKAPYAPMMTVLASPLMGTQIMPKHIYEGTDPKTNPANQAPVGTGPFKFAKWEKGQFIELVRNDNYFKAGKPYLDRIVLQFMPDTAARTLALEKGEVHYIHYYVVPHDQVAKFRSDPKFQVIEKGGEGPATSEFLLLNLRNPYLSKLEVRQAIAQAINLEEIRKKALAGEGKVATSALHSGLSWAFKPSFNYANDVQKANDLLDQAGFKRGADGIRFKVRIAWATGRTYEGRLSSGRHRSPCGS